LAIIKSQDHDKFKNYLTKHPKNLVRKNFIFL